MADQGLHDIEAECTYHQTVTSFDEMDLKSELLRGVYEYGLECPSSIQQRAIVPTIKGDHVIVQAPPATGKTVSLCISALQNIDPDRKTCQILVLTSTAHFTQRLQKTAVDIGQFVQMDRPAGVGNRDIDNTKILHDGQQLVIGTPGRILSLTQRGIFATDSTKLFVLDDADEIFSRGYEENVLGIYQLMPKSAQVVFLTATMPNDVLEAAARMMRKPLHIIVRDTKRSFRAIKQFCVAVETEDERVDILSQLSANFGHVQAIVFCNTRKTVEWLSHELTIRGISNAAMHYDLPAFERADIIADFRSRSTRILLATNMLARGLDKDTSLVVNYELPARPEEYIHRTNLSGRLEPQYITLNLISTAEVWRIHEIEHHYRTQVVELSFSDAKKDLDFTGSIC